jgi:hypothetical protein
MRQLLLSLVQRSLALWLGIFLCGTAGAQSPTSIAELHERWIDLLRDVDGDIAAKTFERMLGLELLVTAHGADGAVNRSVHVTRLDGASLLAGVNTYPAKKFMSASLEWTPGFFAVLTHRSCIDPAKLTADLVAMGWRVRHEAGGRSQSRFAALFQRNDNLAAYGNTVEGKGRPCRLYYQSHYFDPGWIDRNRRLPAKEPEG